jgi:hypothetical protein
VDRSRVFGVFAGAVGLAAATQAVAQQVCRPMLVVMEARLSDVQRPALGRLWFALISVDASRCVADAGGHFDIVFSRLKENAPELAFRERFVWQPPSVMVGVDFAADEAVEHYRIEAITPCPCSR